MSATIIELARYRSPQYIPTAVLRAAMGTRTGKARETLTVPAVRGITAAALAALVEGRAAREATNGRCLAQAKSTLAIAEMKLQHAIDVDAEFSSSDSRAVTEAADTLDNVGDVAIADGRKEDAVEWWNLADRVRADLGRPIWMLAC